jgi:hypothetical protein
VIFIRRDDDRGPDRFSWVRVGLFFLAAGTWLAGVLTERAAVTAAAIVILLIAILLRIAARARGG